MSKEYTVGIRKLGDPGYLEVDQCYEADFADWIKRASKYSEQLHGHECLVDFIPRPHTFSVQSDGSSHLMTPNVDPLVDPPPIVDPALEAMTSGS